MASEKGGRWQRERREVWKGREQVKFEKGREPVEFVEIEGRERKFEKGRGRDEVCKGR